MWPEVRKQSHSKRSSDLHEAIVSHVAIGVGVSVAVTCTEPALQMRDLSLRSTSVHMVSSLSSFLSLRICLMFSASSSASRPRLIVPEIGQVSHRHPCSLEVRVRG